MRWGPCLALVMVPGLLICADSPVDARDAGLPWYWLVFGFSAQGLFMARMLVQWIATERAKRSVMPVAFWWISLAGGISLMAYFLRRGDPVGSLGQLFGLVVYVRNLVFIYRHPEIVAGSEHNDEAVDDS